jgi:glycosyltransferase involved in cell wall biosynthesis
MDATGKIKLCIAGPIWTKDLILKANNFPNGSYGAPFLSTLIKELIKNKNYELSAVTLSSDIKKIKVIKTNNLTLIFCPQRKHGLRFNGLKLGRAIDFFREEINYLIKAYEIINPDIILSNWAYEYSNAAYKSKYKYILFNHDIPHKVLMSMSNLYRLIRFFLAIKLIKKSKNIIVPSEYAKKETKKYTKSPITIIPLPILIKKINKIKTPKKVSKIIMVNNGFNKHKNIETALMAFSLLINKYPYVKLSLFGDEMGIGEKCYLWAKKNNYLNKNLIFNGSVDFSILNKEYSKNHIFLSTAVEETFGAVFVEASSKGLPIIAGKNSGSTSKLLKTHAYLIDITKVKKILFALERLIKDQKFWIKKSFHSSQLSKKFKKKNIIKSYNNYIIKILKNGKF